MNEKDIIGTGWSFPPRFEVANGKGFVDMASMASIDDFASVVLSEGLFFDCIVLNTGNTCHNLEHLHFLLSPVSAYAWDSRKSP